MEKGYTIKNNVIIISRDFTELDFFLRDFLNILKKHSDYLVVSGYVSICSGRSRATEDIDLLFPIPRKESFSELLKELQENNFWCYQGDNADEIFPYIENMNSIRFARTNENFPNIELVPIDETRKAKFFEFKHPQKIKIKDFEFKIPPIEFEILYKEIILTGKKDLEDANHLRAIFSDILKEEKFKEYEPIIRGELKQ
ncbi:MAG: hypothetical protein KJ718_01055 [Nanoarchaeota archaeon]|nr:hypothetical protein [Nanoarchaeota archaeon]